MNILVGTASWTDKTLIACKRFYPRGCSSAEARLRHYASKFRFVEVDSSYYAIPAPTTSQAWVDRTPDGFTFNIKAFRLFTGHWTSPTVLHGDIQKLLPPTSKRLLYYKDLPADIVDELWRRYIAAIEPLREAGKLAAVHFQFAPWVLRNRDGHAFVQECVHRMAGFNVALEFRHNSWFDGQHLHETLAMEREWGVIHTIVDGPQGFVNSVPAIWDSTNPRLAILRLHGRNHETWNSQEASTASDRFNYDYSHEELSQMVPRILAVARMVDKMQVVFNNNMEDQGQRNALTLVELLEAETPSDIRLQQHTNIADSQT